MRETGEKRSFFIKRSNLSTVFVSKPIVKKQHHDEKRKTHKLNENKSIIEHAHHFFKNLFHARAAINKNNYTANLLSEEEKK